MLKHNLLIGPLLVALTVGATVAATLAPDGGGPGVTCDEPYHVLMGKELVHALGQQGWAFFRPANIDRNFDWRPGGPPVQGPLGHYLLGATHWLFDNAPDKPLAISIPGARFAPAAAFALLVFLVGAWTAWHEGRWAGTVAAAAVAVMPRLFGHAHLAALDMLTALLFVAAALAVAAASRGGRTWHFALAGVVWGLAMLVRLHGLLLAPPVVLWLLWRCAGRTGRERATASPKHRGEEVRHTACSPPWRALTAWLVCGPATLLALWPWLWRHPIERFGQYLASGTSRQAVHVFYWGQVWADRQVPWHYPWVLFLVTVPVGLLVLGGLGLWATFCRSFVARASSPCRNTAKMAVLRAHTDRPQGAMLLAATMLFVLLVFSCPGVPVYDGVRLFLMVFPLWAIWVGIGAAWLIDGPAARWLPHRAIRVAAVLAFVALQGAGLLIYRPCQLSYYNLLVGGLGGAEKLGFEVTYWGDTVREPMLADAARRSDGQAIRLVPSLADYQLWGVSITSPALCRADIALVGEDTAGGQAVGRRYAVVYHRRADAGGVDRLLEHGRIISEFAIGGVWLARLVEL